MLVTNLDLDNMKQLQNNFTATEQSKRLLELGVPADSADCYYLREHDDKVYLFQNQKESDNCISKIRLRIGLGHAMPCWSVGRLIEILEITLGTPWSDHEELGKSTLLERVLRDFEDVVKYKEIFKDNRIDFLKLEK
jgi:hypothetical protein